MIGIGDSDGVALPNKQFPKMQSGIVNEVYVTAYEPGIPAIIERDDWLMDEGGYGQQALTCSRYSIKLCLAHGL